MSEVTVRDQLALLMIQNGWAVTELSDVDGHFTPEQLRKIGNSAYSQADEILLSREHSLSLRERLLRLRKSDLNHEQVVLQTIEAIDADSPSWKRNLTFLNAELEFLLSKHLADRGSADGKVLTTVYLGVASEP